jgi:hypothetical protein
LERVRNAETTKFEEDESSDGYSSNVATLVH